MDDKEFDAGVKHHWTLKQKIAQLLPPTPLTLQALGASKPKSFSKRGWLRNRSQFLRVLGIFWDKILLWHGLFQRIEVGGVHQRGL